MDTKLEQEFLAAHDAFAEALFRHCYFRVHDRERAKDLVQEAFYRTWVYLAEGKEIRNLRAFLYKVSNNLIIDEARRKQPLSLETLTEEGFSPKDESLPDAEQRLIGEEINKKLLLLEEPYRTAIIMRFFDELSPKEIALALNLSQNTVSVRIHRGLKKLEEIAGPGFK
ncbi:MAG: hypothetical protein A2849_03345 [Candidatus Taylorbacteria bacterium RIFCSPHIGHO2_01_FULL_51_15]|uniref:RNA polymerase sigma factor n=1 Tax=Candidatus Taylorbacteria bacterium RIFCSPHIGHO2_01_FULL_51_15 TaxID=1802304 RepID=A0A1G2MC81_9BACT|nr:MAG: hypothetical protein A2849_03345 [Candidatus Taylorbacteria bacterium RIFCSPHIGHO2_01_FULL_51_15]